MMFGNSKKTLQKAKTIKAIRPKLHKFEVHLAEHCNLNCQNCDHFSPLAEEKFTDFEQYKKDIARLSKLTQKDVDEIYLLGGEPLLNKNIAEIVIYTRKYFPNTRISVLTNGILLNDMQENFWHTMSKNNISILVTKYPINLNYQKMEVLSKEHNVNFSFFDNTANVLKTSYNMPLDTEGKQDMVTSFTNCYHANACIFLKDGRLYTCSIAPNIEHFNKYFNKSIPDSSENSIDIHKAKNLNQILEFLANPIPMCKYCDVLHRTADHKWKCSTKDIKEWTL